MDMLSALLLALPKSGTLLATATKTGKEWYLEIKTDNKALLVAITETSPGAYSINYQIEG